MSTISTGTSLTTAFVVTGDTSGELVIKTGTGAGTTAMTIDASQNVAFSNPVSFSGNIDANGNLNFIGTGRRITGDMSNATHSNRLLFQTSTANSTTVVGVIPSGTGIAGQINLYSKSDPTNASIGQFLVLDTADTRLVSGITGTGTYLPMTFYTGGSERMRLDTSGNLGIGTASPGVRADISGVMRSSTWSLSGTGVTGGTTAFSAGTVSTDTNWGMYFRAGANSSSAAEYSFRNSADTERLRIGPSGQIGIGGANYGTSGQVLTSNGSGSAPSWQTAGGLPAMNIVSGTTQTATANNHYVLTNASATTVTLPASPAAGDVVWITVSNGRVDNVVARNGQNINSLAENMTINSAYAGVQLRYADATRGWVFT
jgi:hypothetical protein